MRFFLPSLALLCIFSSLSLRAQTTERARPAAWDSLVFGGRFMDRFLPMTNNGLPARNNTWGAPNVRPRYVENGIEDPKWSFWCANIKYFAGQYHEFVVGWPENSPAGHATWPGSILFHAVSDHMNGPFKIKDTLGKGHNAEGFMLKDGRWIVYVIDGYYIAAGINGPWSFRQFDFQPRDREIIDGMSNCTFAQREDGSWLMVNRGGGCWISQTGESPYYQVTEKSAYPPIEGNFEDPVVWRDNVQYNLIVNDWLGRIAYYLRSKDGISWKVEAGEAYMPGIARHEDGVVEGWHKFERMRVLQDSYGRAIQANFAVIDVEKNLDKPNDEHSSKNIDIPLIPGRLLTIEDKKRIGADTKTIRVRVAAEPGFSPQNEIDLNSLHFGGSESVNFGKGSTRIIKTEAAGHDLIITFDATNNGIPADDYAAKLIGKTKSGGLLYGYARLPGVIFTESILSACLPKITSDGNGTILSTEVQNFGQSVSKEAVLRISYKEGDREIVLASGKISVLKPFEKTDIRLTAGHKLQPGNSCKLIVAIEEKDVLPTLLHGEVKVLGGN